MNIGAILAQAAQEGGAGIARRSDVYIALVGAPVDVHVTVDVLVGWPQIGAIAGVVPLQRPWPPSRGPVCRASVHTGPLRARE